MVECDRLEICCTVFRTVGSNPTLSANSMSKAVQCNPESPHKHQVCGLFYVYSSVLPFVGIRRFLLVHLLVYAMLAHECTNNEGRSWH